MSWLRGVRVDGPNGGFYGASQPIGVNVNQTVLKSYWNIGIYGTWGDVAGYPPGSSILRAGLLMAENELPLQDTPTPISNPEADWLDIETINPYVVYGVSNANNWNVRWGFRFDQQVKAMRRNRGPELQGLYVSWEFQLGSNRVDPFIIGGWNCSVDALLSDVTPP